MNIDNEYSELLKDILKNGNSRLDRTGTGTKAVFGRMLKHSMTEGFPLLTSKKVATKQVVSELLWFMRGQTDLKTLVDKKNNIWVGDAYKKYEREVKNMLVHISYSNTYQKENIENGFYVGIKEINDFPHYKLIEDNFVHVEESEDKVRLFNRSEFIERVKQSDIKNDNSFYSMFVDLGKIYGKQWRNVTKNFNLLEYYDKYLEMAKSQSSPYYQDLNNITFDTRGSEQYVPFTFQEFYRYSQPDGDFMVTPSDNDFTEVSFQTMVFGSKTKIDQLNDLVEGIKNNPYGRRHIVNAWNVSELHDMTLPPCHFSFQCFVRDLPYKERGKVLRGLNIDYITSTLDRVEKQMENAINDENIKEAFYISESHQNFVNKEFEKRKLPTKGLSLMFLMRSTDTALGKPFNIASYAVLLEILARETNLIADELIYCGGDVHLYSDHLQTAQEQAYEPLHKLCKIKFSDNVVFGKGIDVLLESITEEDITFENYEHGKDYKYPLSN